MTLIVADNDGGGIFSFLPQAGALAPETFERYWGTPHGLDLCGLAAAYGLEARRVSTRAGLSAVLGDAARPGVRVAVVPSNRASNVEAHRRLDDLVRAAVEPLAPA